MAKEKEVKYYVVIVDGKPLSSLLSDRTEAERSKIKHYKTLCGIEVVEAVKENFDAQKKMMFGIQQQKFHLWFTGRIYVSN